jgi:hypothetical protein
MLKKLILPILLVLGVNANAQESYFQDEWDYKGLIGLELGYMGAEVQRQYDPNTCINPNCDTRYTDSSSNVALGLKLGAEGRHYRAFIDARTWYDSDYESAFTAGLALQYLIRLNNNFNFFLGINGGLINSERDEYDPYYGLDAGINFDFNENLGLEVGARYSDVSISDSDDMRIDYFYQGYVSIIFKFTDGDY